MVYELLSTIIFKRRLCILKQLNYSQNDPVKNYLAPVSCDILS